MVLSYFVLVFGYHFLMKLRYIATGRRIGYSASASETAKCDPFLCGGRYAYACCCCYSRYSV